MASENVDGVKLLQDIANKENNPEAAENHSVCSVVILKIKLNLKLKS